MYVVKVKFDACRSDQAPQYWGMNPFLPRWFSYITLPPTALFKMLITPPGKSFIENRIHLAVGLIRRCGRQHSLPKSGVINMAERLPVFAGPIDQLGWWCSNGILRLLHLLPVFNFFRGGEEEERGSEVKCTPPRLFRQRRGKLPLRNEISGVFLFLMP